MAERYRVEVSDAADLEADDIYLWIQRRSPQAADRWYRGLLKAYQSLSIFPYRFQSLPSRPDLRRLLYGKYRIVFRIVEPEDVEDDEGIVRILHIYHGARQTHVTEEDENA